MSRYNNSLLAAARRAELESTMPLLNGPYDEDELDDRRRYKAPKALRRLQKQFTYDKQLAAFRLKYNRDPASETELEVFCEHYLIGIYNGGFDTI
jgi:hypothetical protein